MNSQSTSLAGNSTEVLREGLAAGEAAEKSGDSKRALQIYTELQDRFPDATMPFLRAAAMLRRNRRFEDAEALLVVARQRFTDDPELAAEYAWVAHDQHLWSGAHRRWAALRAQFPNDPWGYFGGGNSLLAHGRVDEAEALLTQAVKRFPQNRGITGAWAEAATRRGDWSEAASRWEKFRAVEPTAPEGYINGATVLAFLEKREAADALIAQAAQLFPENLRVTAEAVWLALWLGTIEEAARRLEMAEARCRGTAPAPGGIELARNVLARLSRSDSPTLNRLSRQRAAEAIYFPRAPETSVPSRIELHAFAARYIGTDRPVRLLEFGVAGGASILGFGKLFTHPDSRFTGFDSFRGLPEQWHDKPAGTFSMAGKTPITDDPRIDFVSGWFQDTLPGFLSQLPASESRERTILVHFDADLYSATLFVLTMLWNVFDNYYFITDELYLDEVVALYDFVRSYPTQLEFYARGGGGSGVPLYAFGRLRRVGFDEAIKIGG